MVEQCGLLRAICTLQRSQIVIINYHRIAPDDPAAEPLFEDALFGPSQSGFELQVRWLRQHFDVINESELIQLTRASTFRGRYAAITFDDGYRDNYTLAYPVLKACSTPAIYYICPRLIDTSRVGWWDLAAYLAKRTAKRSISIAGKTFSADVDRRHVIRYLCDLVKSCKSGEPDALLDDLFRTCDVPMPDARLQSEQFMTWDQIREVGRQGIAIGSHTYTHRILSSLDETAQQWEMKQSKQSIEGHTGQRVRTLAYPVGGYEQFTPATMRLAEESGYEAAFSFHTGTNYPGRIHPYNVKRIASTNSLDPMFTCGAYFPEVFPWFRPAPRDYTCDGSARNPLTVSRFEAQ